MTARRLAPLLLGLLLPLTACREAETVPPDVVARVGERTITVDDFKTYLARNAGTELVQVAPEAASALLDQYVEEALLSEWAASQGIDVSSEKVAAAVRSDPGSTVAGKRDEMRRAAVIDRITDRVPAPSEEDIQRYYTERAAEFTHGERVRARQILLHDRALAQQVRQQLAAGASFAELSAKHSSAPNAREGGDIGFVSRDQLPKLFEDEIFALQPGQISRVVETGSSFHIFAVDEHAPAGKVDIEAAKPTIRAKLLEAAVEKELGSTLAEARKSVSVEILARRLPFRYSGTFPVREDG